MYPRLRQQELNQELIPCHMETYQAEPYWDAIIQLTDTQDSQHFREKGPIVRRGQHSLISLKCLIDSSRSKILPH